MSDSTDDNCPPFNNLLPPPPMQRDCKFIFAFKVQLKRRGDSDGAMVELKTATFEGFRHSCEFSEHKKETFKELIEKRRKVIVKELIRQVGKLVCNSHIDWRGNAANEKIDFLLNLERLISPDDTEDEPCAICLENMQGSPNINITLPCCHEFHANCIYKWVGRKLVCPICRHSLPSRRYPYFA